MSRVASSAQRSASRVGCSQPTVLVARIRPPQNTRVRRRHKCAARGCRNAKGRRLPFCHSCWLILCTDRREDVVFALHFFFSRHARRSRDLEPLHAEIRAAALSLPLPKGLRHCRRCGCTDDLACPGGCHWVEHGSSVRGAARGALCSQCARVPERVTPSPYKGEAQEEDEGDAMLASVSSFEDEESDA
jgi:hypothetical protein